MHKEFIDDPRRLQEGSRFERKFITTSKITKNTNENNIFTVASYNVLSEHLLNRHPENYVYCDQRALGWGFRSGQIIQEILHFMPDIVCLQEVHYAHYKPCFMEQLNAYGYYGKYKRRPGTSNEDGCAIFYKLDRFTLREFTYVVYDEYDGDVDGRFNVAMIMVLTLRSNQKNICVANTHLLYNPKRGDIKLSQLCILLAEVDALKRKYSSHEKVPNHHKDTKGKQALGKRSHTHSSQPCAVLVCGDLNIVPFSPLYSFLSHGGIDTSHLVCSQVSGILPPIMYGGRPLNSTKLLPSRINSSCQFISPPKKNSQTEPRESNVASSGGSVRPSTSLTSTMNNISLDSAMREKGRIQVLQMLSDISNNNNIDAATTSANNNSRNNKGNKNNNMNGNTTKATNSDISTTQPPHLLTHSLNLTSAYPHLVNIHTPACKFTDMQVTQCSSNEEPKTFDYIFYGVNEKRNSIKDGVHVSEVSKEGPLKLLKYLQLPVSSSQLLPLPNRISSSDHLLIMAEFLLK